MATFLPLYFMKKKNVILSLSFAIMVLSAIVLQSVHSFHHLEQFLTEKHCDHHYNDNNPEIGHAHSDLDDCFVCEFAFSSVVETPAFSFNTQNFHTYFTVYFFCKQQSYSTFSGCLFADRAPPILLFA